MLSFPGSTSVTVRRQSSTVDDFGDATEAPDSTVAVDRALFEPQQFVERTDSRSPGVISSAKWYLLDVLLDLDSDDEIDGNGKTWRVVGGSSPWNGGPSLMGTEVPVERVSEV